MKLCHPHAQDSKRRSAFAGTAVLLLGLLALTHQGVANAADPDWASRITITTSVPAAQETFNEALMLTYAFNHGTAEKTYRKVAELDPQCAMACRAIALNLSQP